MSDHPAVVAHPLIFPCGKAVGTRPPLGAGWGTGAAPVMLLRLLLLQAHVRPLFNAYRGGVRETPAQEVHRVNAFVRKGLGRFLRERRIQGGRKPAASRKRVCSQGVTAFGPGRAHLPGGKPAASRKRVCSQGVTAFGPGRADPGAEKGAPSRKRVCSQRSCSVYGGRRAARGRKNRAASRKRFCSQRVAAFTPRSSSSELAPSRKRLCSQGLTAFTAKRAARAARKPAASRKRVCSQES